MVFTFAKLFIFAGQMVSDFVNFAFSLMKITLIQTGGIHGNIIFGVICRGIPCKTLCAC